MLTQYLDSLTWSGHCYHKTQLGLNANNPIQKKSPKCSPNITKYCKISPKYLQNVTQISSKYWPNIAQILPKYCSNITQIGPENHPNIAEY